MENQKILDLVGWALVGSMLMNLIVAMYSLMNDIGPNEIYGSLTTFLFIWGISGIGTTLTLKKLYRRNHE